MEEEILDVVDEQDKFIRKTTRKDVRENVLAHRTARVIIKNPKQEFFIQKRSKNKLTFPSHLDIGIAETVKSGEGYVSAAMRGLMEEVGIVGVSNIRLMHSFLFKIKYTSSQTNEHCKVYELTYDGKIKPQDEEIDDIKFLIIDEIKSLMGREHFHPVGALVFKKYLENIKK